MRRNILRAAPVIVGAALAPLSGHAADMLVYFGTHRTGPNVGFSLARFDSETGALTRPEFLEEADAPAFFVIQRDGKQLYSCNSIDRYRDQPQGSVSAYAIQPRTGRLTLLNREPTGGAGPCYVSLDRTGRFALVANYNGGSVCVYGLQPDGRLGRRTAFVQHTGHGVHPQRQTSPHPHSVLLEPGNRFALVPDLGLDRILVYRFDANSGALTPNDPPSAPVAPGSGPRHLAFHPNRKWAYVVNELTNSITAFSWNADRGSLEEFQTVSTLPADFKGSNTAAEIAVHFNGLFLYASNRGHDSIAVFGIDPKTGRLRSVEHVSTRGKMPRNFALDPSGKWLLVANHDSDNAVLFRVDGKTGKLTQTGGPLAAPNPFCVRFLRIP